MSKPSGRIRGTLDLLILRWRSLWRRDRVEASLAEELAFHLEEQQAELIAQGMSEAEAAREARRRFGSPAVIAEECRDKRGTRWLEDLAADTRFAWRTLAAAPGFTWGAVGTLALGVGANLAFFSAAYGVLWRPLPYPEPERLVEIQTGIGGIGPTLGLREGAKAVEWAGAEAGREMTLERAGEAARIETAAATANLARVLGAGPARGRWFDPGEESAGAPRVAVISDRMWRERFGGSPAAVGSQIRLNEVPHTIIGVMPPDFGFPAPATALWTAVRVDPRDRGGMWGGGNLRPLGRLRPGVTMAAAQGELGPVLARVRGQFPWRMPDAWGRGAYLTAYRESLVQNARPKLLALAAASLLLLVIACGNVANLLLTRWVRREREFRLRAALGAGRGRLLRQLLTENLVLSAAGGAAGTFAAWGLLRTLPALLGEVPRGEDLTLDGHAALAAGGTMLATFLVFSLGPWFRPGMPAGGPGTRSTATLGAARLSLALAGLQLALATALLIGAGLMGRTLARLDAVDTGMAATGVVTGAVAMGPSRCAGPAGCAAFLREAGAALAEAPGVRSVNWSSRRPLDRRISATAVDIEDHPVEPGQPAFVLWHTAATPGYFAALGIPLREGRWFNDADRDGAPRVTMISEATARRFWPGASAVGKRIRPVAGREAATVIGVVGDVAQYALTGFPSWVDGTEYVPLAQALPVRAEALELTVFVELTGTPAAGSLEGALRRRFPDVVLSRVSSMAGVRRASVADRRGTAGLLGLFAGLGLLLGAIGVYGVAAQRAAQRTREIGIRMALGATAGGIAGMVLREAAAVAAGGAALGLLAGLGVGRVLRALLFGVAPMDTPSFLGAPAVLVAVALAAAAIPGWRAARVDPARVLRGE